MCNMLRACVNRASVVFQIFFSGVPNFFDTCSGVISNLFKTRRGCDVDLFLRAKFQTHVPNMFQTYSNYVPTMFQCEM